MDRKIFPASIFEQSADQIFQERSGLSGVLYLTTLLVIIAALVAINFIHIDVNVRAPGMIKPKEDHTVVTATSSGFVSQCKLVPNAKVREGDTLFVITSDQFSVKLPSLEKRRDELKDLTSDLNGLTTKDPNGVMLKSPMYKQDVLYYIAQLNEAKAKCEIAGQSYERSKQLFDANVIPLSEFEPVKSEYVQADNALKTLYGYQKRQWQSDLFQYETELRDIETQIEQINIQNSETVIVSPVTGTLQQTKTLFDGTYVTAGQQIAELSPDGDLIAECYISPKDIGYMKPGMTGKVQVSAFNYTEWGMLTATVDEIFDDVTVSSDGTQSFYKVYCSLDSNHLKLKNGYEGYIKKGMVVNTNFIVTRRTVFQLLYDKLDNWLNPNIDKEEDKDNE